MGALHIILGAVSGIAEEGGDFGRWANLGDARVGGISMTGLGAVFAGLAILFGLMTLLGWIFYGRAAALEAKAEPDVGGASGPDSAPEGPPTVEPEPEEDEAFVLPETPVHMIPSSLISGAALALHLYDKGGLVLGENRSLVVDGISRTVTLLAVGYTNRATVDGEEIIFSRTRIAPDEAA